MLQIVENGTADGPDDLLPGDLQLASNLADELVMRLKGVQRAVANMKPRSVEMQTVPRTSALITPEEAAESLRVSRTVVYALIKNGSLRSVKIGSSRRVPVGAIDEYVSSLES